MHQVTLSLTDQQYQSLQRLSNGKPLADYLVTAIQSQETLSARISYLESELKLKDTASKVSGNQDDDLIATLRTLM